MFFQVNKEIILMGLFNISNNGCNRVFVLYVAESLLLKVSKDLLCKIFKT